ncbi:hypothetical protein [Streptomyces vietnamensis]|uniref:Alcohol dehydrogenase-like C-terminal domain-containing protein n=1 Tax=Streptomyces vietnamensis TaxID=362257 RepID=A0A0B5IIU7_9ACTN|nr:hypothetical protein [Streptomyces vietnamensis]AJF68314.1 hypothetical protein SVTN_32110 [Streptomyces vietnamensis]
MVSAGAAAARGRAAVSSGRPAGAKIVLVGVCLRPDTVGPGVVAGRELDIRGSFGGSPGEYRQTLRDTAEGRIDAGAVVTGVTGLDGPAGAIAELGEPERHAEIVVGPSPVAG